MNLVLFFEGTGQGVAGSYTNVTRLRDLCVEDEHQRLHLESGPGTHFGAYAVGAIHGIGWRQILRRAKTWFGRMCGGCETEGQGQEGREGREGRGKLRIYLFGFSRGALIARRFAEELEEKGVPVAFLGVWDTVDSTINLDVKERCPSNVRVARHAVARDETRRFFSLVPLLPAHTSHSCFQLVFPGSHSDVGGLYPDNHVIADASLGWMTRCAVRAGLRLKPGAEIPAPCDFRTASLHDSSNEPSNLWGAFDPVRRVLKGLRRHASCKLAVTRLKSENTPLTAKRKI